MTPKIGDLLARVNDPSDLRKIKPEDLPKLCAEIRQFIIDVISTNPGHLGASLGTVELTVAIHYVFNKHFYKIIWDVGLVGY